MPLAAGQITFEVNVAAWMTVDVTVLATIPRAEFCITIVELESLVVVRVGELALEKDVVLCASVAVLLSKGVVMIALVMEDNGIGTMSGHVSPGLHGSIEQQPLKPLWHT